VKIRRTNLLICLVIGFGTAALYFPAAGFKFADSDDLQYIVENYRINSGFSLAGVTWCFHAGYAANWHPLTWLSHMLDCQLFGLNPGGHHVTNVLFHVANSVLFFLLLQQMTAATWRSAMVAALFAWHPIHVESVAWIAERKDVLSTFFWLLTLIAYVRYADNLRTQISSYKSYYALSLTLFALALMSKPMVVTLPFLLLLLDWWPLRRLQSSEIQQRIIEKIPFFVLAACCCVLTVVSQAKGGAIQSLDQVPLHFRTYNTVVSYWRYLGKLAVPVNLAAIYPIGPGPRSIWFAAGAAFGLLIVSVVAIALRRTRPYLLVGWFWYLGTLVPVIGLVQVGGQTMADRYTYVPSVGIFILVCWAAHDCVKVWGKGREILGFVGISVLVLCVAATAKQLQYWRNGETLFVHAINVVPDNSIAHAEYAQYLVENSRFDEAKAECLKALSTSGRFDMPQLFLGMALYHEGLYDQARQHLRLAMRDRADAEKAGDYLGRIALVQNAPAEAEQDFRQTLALNPDFPNAYYGLGQALAREGKPQAAQSQFQHALSLRPDFPEARRELQMLESPR
jgi:Tfp pilus assembly protein PilF